MNNQNQMKSMEKKIVNRINSLKDEIINLKEIVIRNLKDVNEKLRRRCERLENDIQNMNQTIILWHSMVEGTM